MKIAHGVNRVYYVMQPLIDELIQPKSQSLEAVLEKPGVHDKREREINEKIRATLPEIKGRNYLFLPGIVRGGVDYFHSTNQLAGKILEICRKYMVEDLIFIPVSIVPTPFWYSSEEDTLINSYLKVQGRELRYTKGFAKPLYEYSKSIFDEWETKWVFASAFKTVVEILEVDEVGFYGLKTSPERKVLEILENRGIIKVSDARPMRNERWPKNGLLEEGSLQILESMLKRYSRRSK